MYGLRVRVASLVLTLMSVSCWHQQMPPPATPPPSTNPLPATSTSSSTPPPAPTPPCATGAALDLNCAAFPNTDVQFQPDWDYFAWNTFIAANWPAIDPAANSEQRGIPDLTQNFVNAAPDALLTWETYKEKREVFYPLPAQGATTPSPGVWNQAPQYGPASAPAIPMCSGSNMSSPPRRIFLQGGKMPSAPAETFNSLDETREVPSAALETEAELCAGVQSPQCGGSSPAPCCLVKNQPVMPEVWKGKPAAGQPVVYEVKVNYDFFQYVTANTNQFYIAAKAATAATAGTITLPYRTSASMSPNQQTNAPSVYGYNALQAMQSYQAVSPTSSLTPAPSGAIHLKAAWVLLKDEDPSHYHTTEAAYFKTQGGAPCMTSGTFGLVGLHIIQRIHRSQGANAYSQGGTFIFATWEHVDNDGAFTYSNHFKPPAASSSSASRSSRGTAKPAAPTKSSAGTKSAPTPPPPPPAGFYPSLDATLPVRRLFPILPGTEQVNNNVHQAIRAVNPNSVWLKYKLIGVQFQPVHVPVPGQLTANLNDPTNIGQPLFLANSVIETNIGLQYFQGLPPNEPPTAATPPPSTTFAPQFLTNGIKPNPSDAFDRTLANVSYNGSPYNMGGCMGCHGVAQLRGYSFSFVLLLNQNGATVEAVTTPTAAPPTPPPPPPPPRTGASSR